MNCRRWSAQPFKLPEMAPLPKERVTRAAPFENTGVDYAGPFTVKGTKGEPEKRWICLFTCLSTRAVHLESVKGMSTAEFLEAFEKFASRRGYPKTLLSDNGTQFLAAAEFVNAEWQNITARAPWKGGVYERLIGLMKNSMKKAIGKRLLHENEWETLVIKTEGLLNNRPICQVSDDTNAVLRPIDFLSPKVGLEGGVNLPDKDEYLPRVNNTRQQVQSYFSKTETCLNALWRFWYQGYLQNLRERAVQSQRQSHRTTKRAPREGELVLVEGEEFEPRGRWPLAKILKINPTRDGKIRTAKVQLGNGHVTNRAINQLYPLEVNEETETQRELGDQNIEAEASENEIRTNLTATVGVKIRRPASRIKKEKKHWLFYIFIIIQLFFGKVSPLIAYDCTHRGASMTTINARLVEACYIKGDKPKFESEIIQLVQLADNYTVRVQQCKIMLTRTISYCGMHSHASVVSGGQLTYMLQVGENACKQVQLEELVAQQQKQLEQLQGARSGEPGPALTSFNQTTPLQQLAAEIILRGALTNQMGSPQFPRSGMLR